MVLQQARGGADDRGRDPPRAGEDLYVVLGGYDVADAERDLRDHDQSARELDLVRVRGDGVRHRPRAAAGDARSPSSRRRCPPARRRHSLLLLLLLLPASLLRRRATRCRRSREVALERQLEGEILCTCGCRAAAERLRHAELRAGTRARRAKLRQYLREGKDHDAVVRCVRRASSAGRTSCRAPVDKGFNRLAWFFPYLIGATGAASVAVVALPLVAARADGRGRRRHRRRTRSRGWTMSSATSTGEESGR